MRSLLQQQSHTVHYNFLLVALLLVLLVVSALSMETTSSTSIGPLMVGSYTRITDLENDPRVETVAQFALEQALLSSTSSSSPPTTTTSSSSSNAVFSFSDKLQLDTVKVTIVLGYRQVVAGMNYKLILVIQDKTVPDESSEELIRGGFGVSVYDHFSDLSITKWGKELTVPEAKELLQNKEAMSEEAMANLLDNE